MNQVRLFILAALLAAFVAPASSVAADESSGPDSVYFEQTGHYLSYDFLEFWLEHGGIKTFGYPVSPVIEQDGLDVQYFERHVLELHTSNPDDYRLLPRRLGAEARDERGIADRGPFQPDSEEDGEQYFPATAQNMGGGFLSYWQDNGGERILGQPISSEFRHYGTWVQFTERAVLEYHPDNPSGWRILTERLGAQAAERDGIDTSPQAHDGETPNYSEGLWESEETRRVALPSELRIDRIGVTADFEHVGLLPNNEMEAPAGWNNVAWYEGGAVPGEQGTAVVAGHYDAPGGVPAIFWDLNHLAPGDRVTIISEAGEQLVFEVTDTEQFHINSAPNNRIFGQTDEPTMNLVTCAGSWDSSLGMYDQRLAVYTTLVSD